MTTESIYYQIQKRSAANGWSPVLFGNTISSEDYDKAKIYLEELKKNTGSLYRMVKITMKMEVIE